MFFGLDWQALALWYIPARLQFAFLITVCVPCGMTLRKTWWQKAFAPKVEQLPQLNPLFGN